jgi:choline kinase
VQVVILAAGRGKRLGVKADGLPKCLLQVGGEPLLEHQLRALSEVGASPVLVVVGYGADLVREALRDRAETVLNARYDTTNSLASLWLAREWVKGPLLILNSDVFFGREALELLVRAGPDHLAYDSTSGRAAEHMKVLIRDGAVADLSKGLPAVLSSGENVGMVYLGAATARELFEKAGELVAAGREDAFWVEALRAVTGSSRIRGVDVAHVPWVEIDTPYDLDRARREVWPSIADRASPGRRARRWMLRGGAATLLLVTIAATWSVALRAVSQSWEHVTVEGGREVSITVGEMPQQWHEIRPSETATVEVMGPRSIRVDLRALLERSSKEEVSYVVEVCVDGKRAAHEMFTARPKEAIGHPEAAVCDRDKIHLSVSEGRHRLGVRLETGNVAGLLVRLRILEERE